MKQGRSLRDQIKHPQTLLSDASQINKEGGEKKNLQCPFLHEGSAPYSNTSNTF